MVLDPENCCLLAALYFFLFCPCQLTNVLRLRRGVPDFLLFDSSMSLFFLSLLLAAASFSSTTALFFTLRASSSESSGSLSRFLCNTLLSGSPPTSLEESLESLSSSGGALADLFLCRRGTAHFSSVSLLSSPSLSRTR